MTVTDVDAAAELFDELFGAVEIYRREFAAGSDPDFMQRSMNAHPGASVRLIKMNVGGLELELFEYSAPDTATTTARNADPGGHHLAFAVDDIDEAVKRLRLNEEITVLGEISELPDGHPLARRRWIYFLTPWGQQLELVCDPAD